MLQAIIIEKSPPHENFSEEIFPHEVLALISQHKFLTSCSKFFMKSQQLHENAAERKAVKNGKSSSRLTNEN